MKGFRADIEGLRGVAVLLVVADHLTGWPRGGFLGVDVFFVLSGFLITGLLVAEGERTGRISLRGFYARRARRLLPVAVLVLLVTDLAAGLLLLPARAHATVVDSLWSLASLANVRFAWLGTDYFSQTRPPSAVQHYWSLSVEEQFYLVWPGLVLLGTLVARRRGWPLRRLLLASAGLLVAGSFGWSVLSAGSSYFSSPARAWEIGAGALLALARPSVRARPVVAGLGGLGLALSVLLIGPTTAVPGYAAALPVLSTVALLHGAPPALGGAALRYVGRISYSLYLWHWPVITLAADVPGGTSLPGTVLSAVLALALAAASYHLVEAPVRASGWLSPRRHVRRRRSLAPALGLLTALAFVAAYAVTGAGGGPVAVPAAVVVDRGQLPPDLAPQIRAGLALRTWPPGLGDVASLVVPEWARDKCLDVDPQNARRCTYGPAHATKVAALLGDSVAISWLPALRRAAQDGGFRLHVLTRRQCPNPQLAGGATKAVSASCAQHQRWALEQVRRLHPDLLLLSNRYGGATAAQWATGVAATLAQVVPAAGRTVLIGPPPETGNLQTCHTRLSVPAGCTAPISPLYEEFTRVERAAADRAGARFVDPRSWFCVDGRCPAVVAGLPVHFDGRHLSAPYARLLGPYLWQALRPT